MEGLPHELLHQICESLDGDNESLAQVRLVNKIFADVAAKRMFRSLLVYQLPHSWRNVKNISETSHLARYVKRLELATLPYLPCYDFEEWKEETRPFRLRMADKLQKVAILMETYCFLPYIDTLLGLHARYAKYTQWRDGERAFPEGYHRWMADYRFNAPYSGTSRHFLTELRLPNLQGIRMLGHDELKSVQNPTYAEGSPLWKANKREVSTCFSSRSPTGKVSNNVHLRFALCIMDLCHINITFLELHRYCEILLDRMVPTPALQSVRVLKLELRLTRHEYKDIIFKLRKCHSVYALAPWLANLDSLEKLIVVQAAPIGLYVDLIELMRAAPWPKLRRFHFQSPVTTNSGFLSFVREHFEVRNGPLLLGKPEVCKPKPAHVPETSMSSSRHSFFAHRVDRGGLQYRNRLLTYLKKYFGCECSRHTARRKQDSEMAIAHWGDVPWGTPSKANPYDEHQTCG